MPCGRSENAATAPVSRIPYRFSNEHVRTTYRGLDVCGREDRPPDKRTEDAGISFLVPSTPLSVVADSAPSDVHDEIPFKIVTRCFRPDRRSATTHADRRIPRKVHSGFIRSSSADMTIGLVP